MVCRFWCPLGRIGCRLCFPAKPVLVLERRRRSLVGSFVRSWEAVAANFFGDFGEQIWPLSEICSEHGWESGRACLQNVLARFSKIAFGPMRGPGGKVFGRDFRKVLLGQWEGLTAKFSGESFGKY